MVKRWNKKGQFYLIAAIIIIAVIITLTSSANYSRKKTPIKIQEIGEELEIEAEKIMDYAIKQKMNKTKLINNFTKLFDGYLGKGTEIYYIVGDKDDLQAYKYFEGVRTSVSFTNTSTEIEIDVDRTRYKFNIFSGENFHFVMDKEIGGEHHIATNGGTGIFVGSSIPDFLSSDNGLVSWYRFEGDADDYFSINDGTLIPSGGFNFPEDVERGEVVEFDDDDTKYIDLGSDVSLQTSNFSYLFWVKLDGIGTRTIISSNKTNNIPELSVETGNHQLRFRRGTGVIGSANDNLDIGVWTHIALTHNSSSDYIFYINGTESGNGAGETFDFTSYSMRVGLTGKLSGNKEPFDGLLDDLMIFNRPLNSSEVWAVYNATIDS